MTHRTDHRTPWAGLFLGLGVAILAAGLAGPAQADDRDHGNYNGGRDQPHRPPPPPHVVQHDQRRPPHPYDDRDRGPDMYYSAPPVIYQPPGPSLSIILPLYR